MASPMKLLKGVTGKELKNFQTMPGKQIAGIFMITLVAGMFLLQNVLKVKRKYLTLKYSIKSYRFEFC
jgi:hypothetical protein